MSEIILLTACAVVLTKFVVDDARCQRWRDLTQLVLGLVLVLVVASVARWSEWPMWLTVASIFAAWISSKLLLAVVWREDSE